MAGLGWQELVIVLVIVMIIFGAGKLPEVARSLGQGVKEFKTESSGAVDSGATTASAAGVGAAGTVAAASHDTVTVDGVPVEKREMRADEI